MFKGEVKVPATYLMRLHPELKMLLGRKADEEGLPLNEYLSRILADMIGRPELGKPPRISIGRPRSDKVEDPKTGRKRVPA